MNKFRVMSVFVILAMLFSFANVSPAVAATTAVTFQEGTATFSQDYPCCALPVDQAVDGYIGSPGNNVLNGWAIHPGVSQDQIAVWETASDVNASQLDFKLYQYWGDAHNFGRFRLSYTTDNRGTFADGLNSGGDVTANWTVLTGATITSTGGETFTVLPDNSILVSGNNPATTVYSLSFSGSFSGITGIRLEALSDASLPFSGPGRQANGNFTLTEITLDATIPTPLPKVALLGSETGVRLTDIVNKVTAAGAGLYTVTNLSGCPLATPSLATLQQYQVVMVWSDCVFNNSTTLGDVLADYVDGGGHVVVAAHVWWPYTASATQTLDIRGRFASGGYNPLTLGSSGIGGPTWSLVADLPSSSLFTGVASFTTQSVDNTNSLAPGATLAAHYGIDNRPAVAFKGNVVALNFFPASSDAQAGFWNSSTDGARLIANALLFTGAAPVDTDGDGVADATDNCPAVANASQTNTDGDSLGDACDTDDDGDGALDINDAFPLNPAESVDTDGDGIGDNADPAESVDTDGDGTGNNADTDDDGDGVDDASDAFPLDATESADNDGDGIGDNADPDDDNDGTPDAADAFPFDAGELADSDGDGMGDNADPDDDNDGVLDAADAFPFNPGESVDSDGDGIGNNADTDDDGDGVDDAADAFPLNPIESVDTDSDGIGNNADSDDDNDTVDDASDAFPLNPTESVDTDGDGTGDNTDTDDDGDGVTDAADAFPLDLAESVDSDGDGVGNNADADDDNDGIADASDAFPLDPFESADMDGDGIGNNTDTDDDGDGVLDVDDAFPLNPNESVDTDGDGVGNNADPDADGDGVNDLTDACSLVSGAGTDADNNGCVDVITDLSGLVQSFNLHKGTQTSLLAKVNSAMTYLNAGNTADAISSLQAFINETRAQRGKKLSATQADILIAFAQNVIARLQQ